MFRSSTLRRKEAKLNNLQPADSVDASVQLQTIADPKKDVARVPTARVSNLISRGKKGYIEIFGNRTLP